VASPGDVLAVESPTYFVVLQIIESLGIKTVEIPTYPREGICLDALTGVLAKTKVKACLLMPTVHNPLGATMPEAKRRKLVSILADRDIPLIEDDIFGDLHFGQRRPRAVKAFDKQGIVLLCSSFSKTLAPGYRVGWVAPGRYRNQVLRLKMVTTMGNPVLTQMMIADFLQNGGYDQHLRRIRKAYASQVEMMTQAIDRHFPDGTRVTRPSGGFVVWVEFPKSIDALDLHRRALERRISIAPGPIFSPVGGFRNFARLNCGHVWSERIEEAIRTLGELAGETGSGTRGA
jgi:DNA-binding transcriptional MocR family regulator